MRYSLAVLLLLAGLAVSCAVAAPADLTGINPNLTAAQRDDVAMLNNLVRREGFNLRANLDDVDGNGNLDLVYTGAALKDPSKDLDRLANFNGSSMAGCGYPIDKLVIKAGTDVWTAAFQTAADCAWGRGSKDACAVEQVWKKSMGI